MSSASSSCAGRDPTEDGGSQSQKLPDVDLVSVGGRCTTRFTDLLVLGLTIIAIAIAVAATIAVAFAIAVAVARALVRLLLMFLAIFVVRLCVAPLPLQRVGRLRRSNRRSSRISTRRIALGSCRRNGAGSRRGVCLGISRQRPQRSKWLKMINQYDSKLNQ